MANAVWRVTITQKLGVITSGMWVEIFSINRPMQNEIIQALKEKYGIEWHGTIPTGAMSIVKL